jgi:predicted NUDIX family NTP pyrophosphohydrolase
VPQAQGFTGITGPKVIPVFDSGRCRQNDLSGHDVWRTQATNATNIPITVNSIIGMASQPIARRGFEIVANRIGIMAKVSAGLLMYRRRGSTLDVLLVHPGGPFWRNKDDGAWMIPKGEVAGNEDLLAAAQREFMEETGLKASGKFIELGEVRHRSGKRVHAWAFEGDCDPAAIRSNTFEMEWPPRSGKRQSFAEVDRGAFFGVEEARRKMLETERALLERLADHFPGGTTPSQNK